MLDLMWRLKDRDKISSSQLANIDQAYHICRPGGLIGHNSRFGSSGYGQVE